MPDRLYAITLYALTRRAQYCATADSVRKTDYRKRRPVTVLVLENIHFVDLVRFQVEQKRLFLYVDIIRLHGTVS